MAKPRAEQSAESSSTDHASNKATARTLAVLSEFVAAPGSKGVTELSRGLGMTKSMVYRALSTLVEQGLLIRDHTGRRYILGYGILHLNPINTSEPEVSELLAPYLRQLHELTGETVTLNVPVGRDVLTVDGIEGRGQVSRRVPLGRLVPQHANASGRAILAFRTDAEISRYLTTPLERFTDTTLTTAAEIWEEVALVRRQGYALGYRDHSPQASGVSFPALDCDSHALASVTVSGPAERMTGERVAAFLTDAKELAAEWNRRTKLTRRVLEGHDDRR